MHGVLHLCGYDHEADQGEMLALQAAVMRARSGRPRQPASSGERDDRAPASSASPGRPNVGKSTLVNAIVGAKVAIVSDRPQTTRRAIRGIATDPAAGWQMVLVDLPGVQRPRDALTERMQRRVERELDDADAALLVVDGHQGVGPGDRFIAKALLGARSRDPGGLRGQQVRSASQRRRPPRRWPPPQSSRRWTRCSRSAPGRGRAWSR